MLQFTDFIVDCPAPLELAAFYSRVVGREVKPGSDNDWAGIAYGALELAFQRVDDYRPPQWPRSEHPKQFHLDFEVDEFEPERRRMVELGATFQREFISARGYGWQVFTDPVGHPFCLCRNEGVKWADGRIVHG